MDVLHWFVHLVGADDMSGVTYGMLSGYFGSNLCPNISVLAVLGVIWKKCRCHEGRCARIGVHTLVIDGHHYLACRRHHPPSKGRMRLNLRELWEKEQEKHNSGLHKR